MRLLLSLLLMTLMLPTTQAADQEKAFRRWQEQKLWPDARKTGIRRTTFDAAMGKVHLDWSLPDLVRPGESDPTAKGQSEFGNPSRYFKPGNLNFVANKSAQLEKQWHKTLTAIEAKYGVPRHILLAIWGRESAFGQAKLPHDAIQALATESFVGARPETFYPELLAALKILDQGHIQPNQMKSSWAGALGNPQFMPSAFLKYAVDFDGDGKQDIWTSVPDSLASIAHFLQKKGWQKERDWGFEVSVPKDVPCHLEGPDQGKNIAAWEKLGVKRVSGRHFPAAERKREGFLLFPAGRFGPAFLVTKNFYMLKEYNESDLYALFIGHVADRAQGGKPFVSQWQDVHGFKRHHVKLMQQALERLGHDVGGADGLIGFKTRRSVGRWQETKGETITCFPDAALVKRLR